MRLKKPAPKQNALNLPVLVTEKVEENGRAGVKGKNLLDGSEVVVFLTNQGKAAENSNRNSLEKLFNGFKIGRTPYKLEPGGLVSFKQAFPNGGEGRYLSTWANVLAYNEADAKQYCRRSLATLRMFEKNGKHSGVMFVYEKDPQRHIRGANADAVQAALVKAAAEYRSPSFLVRLVDQSGQVVEYDQISKSYNKEAGRDMTPEEVAAHVTQKLKAMQDAIPGASLNIMPADRYTVSPAGLTVDEQGKSQVTHFQTAAKAYMEEMENGDVELYCKDTFYKVGGDNLEFVNGVFPTDPFGPGQDPVLLGNLKYAPEFVDSMAADQAAPAEEPEAPPAAPVLPATGTDDPFGALDAESFEDPAPR